MREARSQVGDASTGGSPVISASFGPDDVDHVGEGDDEPDCELGEDVPLPVDVAVPSGGVASPEHPATTITTVLTAPAAATRTCCLTLSPLGISGYCWLCCFLIQSRTSSVRITHDVPTL